MGVPFQRGDRIDLASYSSVAAPFTLYANIRRDSGAVDSYRTKVHTPNSDRTIAVTNNVQLGAPGTIEGFVLERRDSGVTIPKRGQCYVLVQLVRGGGPVITNLSTGYWYDPGFSPSLGEIRESGPGGGNGFLRAVSLGNPAVGDDYAAEAVPTNALWRIHGFIGTLVADGTGANRYLDIAITNGTNTIWNVGQDSAVTAGQTRTLVAWDDWTTDSTTDANLGWKYMNLPGWRLPAGYTIAFNTANIVAGDNWGEGFLFVEEWIEI